jgi:hypothetical protein
VFVSEKLGSPSPFRAVEFVLIPAGIFCHAIPKNHHRETLQSLVRLFGKPVSVFSIRCGGLAELDCAWLGG